MHTTQPQVLDLNNMNHSLASSALFPFLQARTYRAVEDLFDDMIADELNPVLQQELVEFKAEALTQTVRATSVSDLWEHVWPGLFDTECGVEDLMGMILED